MNLARHGGPSKIEYLDDLWINNDVRAALETQPCSGALYRFISTSNFTTIPSNNPQIHIVPSMYVPDFLNETLAAALLTAEIQKVCTHSYIPETRIIRITDCEINLL